MMEIRNIKFINPNVLNEGNQMLVLKDNEDEMKVIIRCNNCGKPTEYGNTRMCSGFVGCDNEIIIDGVKYDSCYFDDLMPRVNKEHEKHSDSYINGKLYRYRDNLKTKVGE